MAKKHGNTVKKIIYTAICAVMVFSGCKVSSDEALSVPSFANRDGLGYVLTNATRGDMERLITADGFYGSMNADAPFFKISGTLEEVHIQFGSKVKKGDLLAVLREREVYEAEMKKIEQELVKKSIEIKSAQDKSGESGESGLLKLKYLQEEYNLSQLKTDSATTPEMIKSQEFEVTQAKLEYEASLEEAGKELTRLTVEYESIQERYDTQKKNYESCFLYSAVSGTCTWVRSRYSLGEDGVISAGVIMATISDDSNLQIFFTPLSLDKEHLMLGRSFTMMYNGREYTAKVIQVPETAKSYVRYSISNDKILIVLEVEGFDYSGVTGGDILRDITLVVERRESVVQIPDYLLKGNSENGYYVNELIGDMPVRKPVIAGLRANAYVEIIEGLEEGCQLII